MTDIEERMNAWLYRASCLSSTELGEYHLGMLSKAEQARARLHLAECPRCTEELNQLKTFLEAVGPDLEYNLSERIRIWIAERLPDVGAPGRLAPAFGVRGQSRAPQVYQAGEAELALDFEPDPMRSGKGSLMGLLSGVEPDGLQAQLWQAGRRVASAGLDELGNFVFTGVSSGQYELIVAGEDFEIHLNKLEI